VGVSSLRRGETNTQAVPTKTPLQFSNTQIVAAASAGPAEKSIEMLMK
jgi:hypothetical protein